MGKEWLHYLGGGGSTTSTSNCKSKKRIKTTMASSGGKGGDERGGGVGGSSGGSSSSNTTLGCMNAIFQLFNLHHFQLPLNHPSSSSSLSPPLDNPFHLPDQTPICHLKGVEAPRNSLEIEDEIGFMGPHATLSSPSSSTSRKDDTLRIPMSGIHIKTSGHTTPSRTREDDKSSSECAYSSSSPAGTKTPTLVARLMGLDLLPETSSPRPSSSSSSTISSSKSHLRLHYQKLQSRPKSNAKTSPYSSENNDIVMPGRHSLPETPRTSSSARRSDVEQRFSLQVHKENRNKNDVLFSQEFEFSKFLTTKIAEAEGKENMSPGHYAKQIVKQFKESVSRRVVGRDITNAVDNQRRDQHVVLLKSKKPSSPIHNAAGDCNHDPQNSSTATPNSCSPRLIRLLEIKGKSSHSPKLPSSSLSPAATNYGQSKCTTALSKPKSQSVPVRKEEQQQTQQSSTQNSNNINGSDQIFGDITRLQKPKQTRDFIRRKQEESFVRPSSATSRAKASHLSDKKCKNTPLSNFPTILSVKKDQSSPPITRLQWGEMQKQHHQASQQQICESSKISTTPEISRSSSQTYKQKARHTVTTDVNVCHQSSNGIPSSGCTATTTGAELMEYISRILKCTGIHEITTVSFINWYSPFHPLDPLIFHHLELSLLPQLELPGGRRLVFDVVNELLAGILKPHINLKPWVSSNVQIFNGRGLLNTLYGKTRSFPSANCRVLEDIDDIIDKDLSKHGEIAVAFEEEGDGIVAEVEGDILDTLVTETVATVMLGVRTLKELKIIN